MLFASPPPASQILPHSQEFQAGHPASCYLTAERPSEGPEEAEVKGQCCPEAEVEGPRPLGPASQPSCHTERPPWRRVARAPRWRPPRRFPPHLELTILVHFLPSGSPQASLTQGPCPGCLCAKPTLYPSSPRSSGLDPQGPNIWGQSPPRATSFPRSVT